MLARLATDAETLRYAAGGDRPDEIAGCAARWAESSLDLDDIVLVLACGGYDPDPFAVLSDAGLLRAALCNDDGTVRLVHGERAGTWISDELALASAEETIERTRTMITDPGPASTSVAGRARDRAGTRLTHRRVPCPAPPEWIPLPVC